MERQKERSEVPLADVQATPDRRQIPIDRVGVREVKYPITVMAREGGTQTTVGTFALTVELPHQFKGTHMSRFIEVLGEHNHDLSSATIPTMLARLCERLDAKESHIDVDFVLFREKAAPVTGKSAMMGYQCGFSASGGTEVKSELRVVVPVTTLCPCSREISAAGAHNQRGYVTCRIEHREMLWLEEVIDMVEASGSAPLYPLLKRPDEKFVTEQAYENPRFVEDLVREVSIAFDAEPRILAYTVEVENHESIHDHNAYAMLSRRRQKTAV